MKKYILLFSLTAVFLLSACSEAGAVEEAAAQVDSSPRLTADYSDALSMQEQLIIGTFNLEETALAVDEAQAQTLLPLWRALQSLGNSETTAEAELTAVVNQIQDSMTLDQIEAIAAMQLTADDIQTAVQNAGVGFGFRGGNNGRTDGDTGGAAGPQGALGGLPGGDGFGGPPGGGGLGGPGGGLGQGNADPDTIATRQAAFADGGFEDQPGTVLINPLISLLEVRAGEREAPEPGARGGPFGQVFEIVAAETGLSVDKIQAQTAEGRSLTEIIEANEGDVEAVKAALEAAMAETPLPEGVSLEAFIEDMLD